MKIKLLLLIGFTLCCVCGGMGEEASKVQSAADPTINSDPDRVRAIVESEAQKLGSKAVLFGMWVADREILTMALGHSMTTVPATTEMHYRIGGIAETFMSTLLLMLVEQGRINLDDKIATMVAGSASGRSSDGPNVGEQYRGLHRLCDRQGLP